MTFPRLNALFLATSCAALVACQTNPPAPSAAAPSSKAAPAPAAAPSSGGVASALSGLSSLGATSGSSGGNDRNSNLLGAAADLAKAASITDADVKLMAQGWAKQSDAENKVAPPNSPYAKRLNKLVAKLGTYDGVKLNYKVYQSNEVNAFAMADGTVRVYTGLMDLMTDNELLFVIGHEIAHVKLGHSTASIKNAYQSSAIAKGATAAVSNSKGGSDIMSRVGGQLKGIFEKALTSSHSRSQESESDAYSVKFMKANKIPTTAAVSSLMKLAKLSGSSGSSVLSTHPDPAERAKAVETIASK